MPPLSLLIKPVSSSCNLRCKYCFYHSVAENRTTNNYGIMNENLLEVIVKKALEYADHICTFAFQGGEPTLSGLDFYKKLIELEKKYNVKKVRIKNAIQINGIAIDEKWAGFLADHDFLVGISMDGPKYIHDYNRIDLKNDGSFNRVMNTVTLFNKYKVEYNILSVVTGNMARHIEKVYNFLKKNDFRYLQFIPCLDPINERRGVSEYSLSPERYALFLKYLFDLWYEDVMKGEMISIRYFENLVGMFMGYRPEACGMMGECQCQFVIEADGGVYPCDFYVFDEWLLGNIKNTGFEELGSSDNSIRFISVSKHSDTACKECKWSYLCRGGCRRDRETHVENSLGLNYYCSAYKEFFEYASDRLRNVATISKR